MLKQRVITAFMLAAVFLAVLILAPSMVFMLFIALIVSVAGWEWANLCGLIQPTTRIAYALSVVCTAILLCYCIFSLALIPLKWVLTVNGVWWALALLWVQSYPSSAVLWRPLAVRALMGYVVLLPTLVSLYALRVMPNGEFLVLAVVLLVAAADIGAYFAGRTFGKRKLAPNVSPGKTWEGVVGGLLAVTVISLVYALFTHHSYLLTLAVAIPAAAVSVLGDLLESMLKRQRGIKDSSQLLPGHGGVLDRIDGLLAAAPIFALALVATGWQI